MLGKVRTIVRRLNATSADGGADAWPRDRTSVHEDGGTADETDSEGSDTASPPYLYECPSCDRVYVATGKQTCFTCDAAVERVE